MKNIFKEIERKKKRKQTVRLLIRAGIILMLVNDIIEIAIAYRAYRRELHRKAARHLAERSDKT